MHTRRFTLILLAAILSIAGCPRKDRPVMPMPPEPNPEPEVNKDAEVRNRDLGQKVAQFSSASREIPTNDEGAYRQAVGQVFADLSQILPLIQGPNPPGAFRQQMRILQSSRNQLAGGSADLSAEPTIDSGLRAAYRALSGMQQESFTDRPEIGQTLESLSNKINELDTSKGVFHRNTVKEAVTLIGQAVQSMSSTIDQRLRHNAPSAPATAPSAEPASPATPAP